MTNSENLVAHPIIPLATISLLMSIIEVLFLGVIQNYRKPSTEAQQANRDIRIGIGPIQRLWVAFWGHVTAKVV